MQYKTLKKEWQEEEQFAFKGWDFSHLTNRWISEPNIWDYEKIVKERLLPQHHLLDLGTGGGEFLLSLEASIQPYIGYRGLSSQYCALQ